MDVARLIRLRSALGAAGDPKSYRDALDQYPRLRQEVRDTIPEELHAEFDRLFETRGGGSSAVALSRLRTMMGWIEGMIESARLEAEAEAYARERVKAERGIGFQPPPDSPE